ncbi:hypothetical protein V8F20_011854 [Naviculisporaceae sp. PSN 640]
MSAFEIAGVVLGSLPLLISALEHYGDGVRTLKKWTKYEDELKSVIRNLETERTRLQNTCEKLLDGLVPDYRIDPMAKDPFGSLWQEKNTQKKIRSRLWRSWDNFEQHVTDIKVAIDRALSELENNKIDEEVGSSMKMKLHKLRQAKRIFKLPAYTELLSTIGNGVNKLESLTNSSIELEPKRRAGFDFRLLTILHKLSSSMYRANDIEEIIQDLQLAFRLALSPEDTAGLAAALTNAQTQLLTENLHPVSWEEILIQANAAQILPHPPQGAENSISCSSTADTARPESQSVKKLGFKSMKLLLSPTTTATTAATTTSPTITKEVLQQPPALTPGLCKQLKLIASQRNQDPGRQQTVNCYGTIFDPDVASDPTGQSRRSYTLYPVRSAPSLDLGIHVSQPWKIVSLRDALQAKDGLPPLGYVQRLRLAVLVARSILQFYRTPWLPLIPTSRSVFFIIKPGDTTAVTSYYEHAFVMAEDGAGTMRKAQESLYNTGSFSSIFSPTLLALGVLLVELERNKPIDSMRLPGDVVFSVVGQNQIHNPFLSDYVTAKRLLDETFQVSPNYKSAVMRCLYCESMMTGKAIKPDDGKLDLENEDVRQEVYAGVIALLEEDLKQI